MELASLFASILRLNTEDQSEEEAVDNIWSSQSLRTLYFSHLLYATGFAPCAISRLGRVQSSSFLILVPEASTVLNYLLK
ncbi:hypothetical protein NPIL_494471 [Nephila pilipes]|uniref:Uncharacterized protein n=1 Tax=Nephila pilipes TaxID=299642 RepID=A0A8X6Q2V2_NEPPI|nr:hypothetical protein NPIL_494471 [Nephila pilipes]